MPIRDITAHRDSYMNLSAEVLSVYPTTIFYPWHDLVSSNNIYPILDSVCDLVSLETRTGGNVLAVEEGSTNILEVLNVETGFTTTAGWNVTVKDTGGVNTDFIAIMDTDNPTYSASHFLRVNSGSNTSEEVILYTDTQAYTAPNQTYTLSFYYRTDTSNISGKVTVELENLPTAHYLLETDLDLSPDWKRARLTFLNPQFTGAASQQLRIIINFAGHLDIGAVQLEQLGFASAWIHSPTARADGYVKLAEDTVYPAFFPDDQVAVSTWVKILKYKEDVGQTIIGCATSGYKLWKNPAGSVEFTVHLPDGTFARASFDQELLPQDEWHMVSGLFSQKRISIYLDSLLKDSEATSSELIYYEDDTVNDVKSKTLYVAIDSNLIPSTQLARLFMFSPRDTGDHLKIVVLNSGSAFFYDDVSSEVQDFNFQVSAPTTIFSVPIGEPTDTADQIWVFSGGLLQKEGAGDDYTIFNPTGPPTPFDVVFNSARIAGDTVQVNVIENATGADVTRYDWTAGAAQTAFALPAGVYTTDGNHLLLFCNGLCMTLGAEYDYTETNNTTFTFNSGRELNDVISAFVLRSSDSFVLQNFNANQGQANFNLDPAYLQTDSFLVFSNGILDTKTYDYTTNTQDVLNGYLKNTRIEPGLVDIYQTFVRFVVARVAGDIVDVMFLNPNDNVPGAFETVLTATEVGTDFTVLMIAPASTEDHLLVFCNGFLQKEVDDYTIDARATTTIIQFNDNRTIGDVIKVTIINEDTTTFTRSDTTVVGTKNDFVIGAYTNDSEHLLVFTNGLMQMEGDRFSGDPSRDYYEPNGTTISFHAARQNGDVVTIFKIAAPSSVEHEYFSISSTTYLLTFSNRYAYFMHHFINSNGMLQSIGIDYATTEFGELLGINVNSQVIQQWYETDLMYDWRYRKVIV